MALKVSVWDDDSDKAEQWSEQIKEVLGSDSDVEAADNERIKNELDLLHARRKAFINAGGALDEPDDDLDIDDTDILIVDNDLFELDDHADLTAEIIATRARIYSDCGLIVVLNLNPDLAFDLSLLGHPESKADLHTNEDFVANPGLWQTCPNEDGAFRPWHWPILPKSAALFRKRVDEVVNVFECGKQHMAILDYFQFGDDARSSLSRSARGYLHPTHKAQEVTFEMFLTENPNAAEKRDTEAMIFEKHHRRMARVIASRIAKWLFRMVLGPQDVLIDLPHLVERLPFLIADGKNDDVAAWNAHAKIADEVDAGLLEPLKDHLFANEIWFDRPVFWAHCFETEENLEKLMGSSDSNPNAYVFCEDASSFHPADQCERFVAGFHTTADTRFIRWIGDDDVVYGPQSRLAM